MRPFPALALLLRAFSTQFTLSLLCLCSMAQQQKQAAAAPDAPSASQQQASPQASNPTQGGAQVVSFLARKSIVFPDLATNNGPLSPEQNSGAGGRGPQCRIGVVPDTNRAAQPVNYSRCERQACTHRQLDLFWCCGRPRLVILTSGSPSIRCWQLR